MVKTNVSQTADPIGAGHRYRKLSDLSRGTFGFVQLAHDSQTQKLVAIKFLERGERLSRYVGSEIMNHRKLLHPHVIEFKEVLLTPEHIAIVMEYASAGSLFDLVKKSGHLKESTARWFFQQLMIVIDFCHKKGIVNRDVKLENTLLQDHPGLPLPLVKLCDFGYSKSSYDSAPKSKVGTLAYMAPEILSTSSSNYDGRKADIWSCGVMLFIMLLGRYPFDLKESQITNLTRLQSLVDHIGGNQEGLIPPGAAISADAQDLLKGILVGDPGKRLTVDQIFKHPWFKEGLPPAALTMNGQFMDAKEPEGYQSEEDIRVILAAASQSAGGGHDGGYDFESAPSADSIDDLIDGAEMDNLYSY